MQEFLHAVADVGPLAFCLAVLIPLVGGWLLIHVTKGNRR